MKKALDSDHLLELVTDRDKIIEMIEAVEQEKTVFGLLELL